MREWVDAIERAAKGEDAPPSSSPAHNSAAASSADKPAAATAAVKKKPGPITAGDFLFGRTLGEGAYAKVVLAQRKHTGNNIHGF